MTPTPGAERVAYFGSSRCRLVGIVLARLSTCTSPTFSKCRPRNLRNRAHRHRRIPILRPMIRASIRRLAIRPRIRIFLTNGSRLQRALAVGNYIETQEAAIWKRLPRGH